MKKTEHATKTLPPYMSYKAFLSFLDRLRASGVPTRMDRSVVPSMSGSAQALLFSTLRYLGLITNKNATTQELGALVNAQEDAYEKIWRGLIMKAYRNLFGSNIDLKRTTTEELAEALSREGVSSPDTLRKCVTFFTLAAKDAGIELSPHIKPYAGRRRADRRTQAAVTEGKEAGANHDATVAADENGSTDLQSRVPKLPAFDNSWSEKIKERWFDAVDQLLKKIPDEASSS